VLTTTVHPNTVHSFILGDSHPTDDISSLYLYSFESRGKHRIQKCLSTYILSHGIQATLRRVLVSNLRVLNLRGGASRSVQANTERIVLGTVT
jgi:hypothetical protein